MSRLKKSLLFCLSFMLAFSFIIAPFKGIKQNETIAAENNIQVIDNNLLNYVTISMLGKTIEPENVKTVDTDNDNVLDTSYIISNYSTTLTFEPLKYNYYITYSKSSNFIVDPTLFKTFKLDKDKKFGTFECDNITYDYTISDTGEVSITGSGISSPIKNNSLVTYNKDSGDLTINSSIAVDGSAESSSLSFKISDQENANVYTINFEKPIVNFTLDQKVTQFTCTGLDIGDKPVTTPTIEDELSYENVKLTFTNNNYTETNPLYFDINHNGFIYTFTLYSKLVNEIEYLFVEYYDEQNSDNAKSLATIIGETPEKSTYVRKSIDNAFNMFSIDFKKTGRYEISVYDSSYLLLKDDEDNNINKKSKNVTTSSNYNFYSESFYIKNNNSTAFDNAYVIMQSYDNNGDYINYIASEPTISNSESDYKKDESTNESKDNSSSSIVSPTPTLNTNVQIRVKNLLYYFENDEVIGNLDDEIDEDLQVIEFIKTTLAGSTNIPVSTFYSISQLKELLNKDPDFTINCTEDAFYKVIIRQFQKISDGGEEPKTSYKITATRTYQFAIVKQPKISFTVFSVTSKNDPIYENGKPKTSIYEATVPYTTVTEKYKINISSSMEIIVSSNSHPSGFSSEPPILKKTYLNEYTINYAMQAVSMEEFSYKDEDERSDYLNIQFFGVGTITVRVTVNSTTTTQTINSGDILTFTEYGTYSIAIEDSMGTVGTKVFDFKKPVSTSTVILVVLIAVIAVAVVLFIIASRTKIRTR